MNNLILNGVSTSSIKMNPSLSSKMVLTPPKVLSRAIYGRLYNWYAANDSRMAPAGMRVALYSDKTTIESLYGGYVHFAEKIKDTGPYWTTPTNNNNITGLSMRGAGIRSGLGYYSRLQIGYTWLLGVESGINASRWDLRDQYNDSYSGFADKVIGINIRIVSDNDPGPTITDFEGRLYDIVQIGSLYWTKQAWASAYYANGEPIPYIDSNTSWGNITTPAQCVYNDDLNYI